MPNRHAEINTEIAHIVGNEDAPWEERERLVKALIAESATLPVPAEDEETTKAPPADVVRQQRVERTADVVATVLAHSPLRDRRRWAEATSALYMVDISEQMEQYLAGEEVDFGEI